MLYFVPLFVAILGALFLPVRAAIAVAAVAAVALLAGQIINAVRVERRRQRETDYFATTFAAEPENPEERLSQIKRSRRDRPKPPDSKG